MKIMSFKWQDTHMESFLETYKKYECLWNNKCNDYSKSNAREKAYSLMLNDLKIPGLTVPDIKAKIKTIRTRYVAELAKIRNSELERNEAAGEEVYEPRLFWFKIADAFLRKVCTSKPKYLVMKDQGGTDKEISFEKVTADSQHYEDNDSTSQENTRYSPSVAISPPYTYSEIKCDKNVWKRSLPKENSYSFPNDNNYSAVNNTVKRPKKCYDSSNNEYPNEFDIFCQSLAIQLKKMPLQRALICQQKLQSVMTQERLFQLQPNPSSHDHRQTQRRSNRNTGQCFTWVPPSNSRFDSEGETESLNNQVVDEDDESEFVSEIKWET
ncbi:uncharacterized protein LOC129911112 [Episyrphus balteatus]|uniref:uncharacterized protein LOC129911112 n=1 Tax=Episyrphus balteatus TaxID=286459 RepID=UPI0024867611|nr:uncharacterized protein LOC129911112 [Episyrphus balteatus]